MNSTNFTIVRVYDYYKMNNDLNAELNKLKTYGYTKFQFEYSSAYDNDSQMMEYSVLIIATKE